MSAPFVSFARSAVVAALVGLTACGGWRGNGGTYYARNRGSRGPQEATYGFDAPGSAWKAAAKLKDVQVAWIHRNAPASIRLHSECANHGDGTLDQFLDHLRIGWTQWKVLEEKDIRLVDRAALRAVVSAELDGVAWKHEIVLVKKNGCLFDLTYSARPDAFETGRADFHRVVSSFRFPVRGG